MEVVAYNQNRQQRDLKMYEMGKVYQKIEDGHQEDKKIALAICGRANSEAWNTDDSANDIFRLKGAVQSFSKFRDQRLQGRSFRTRYFRYGPKL